MWHVGDMLTQENFWFQTFWDRFWCRFGAETAAVGQSTANLVIMFETFNESKDVAPLCSEAREKKCLASYCMYSFSRCTVELRDTNTVCHRMLSYLLWYSTMVSVGHSVRSYVSTDLLSTREGSPSKGGSPYPPWIRHWPSKVTTYLPVAYILC